MAYDWIQEFYESPFNSTIEALAFEFTGIHVVWYEDGGISLVARRSLLIEFVDSLPPPIRRHRGMFSIVKKKEFIGDNQDVST